MSTLHGYVWRAWPPEDDPTATYHETREEALDAVLDRLCEAWGQWP